MKKYELTSETKVINGVELHRIKALESFGCVEKGELGGWIESEKNLSRRGDAWVFENAKVFGDATVCGYAKVCRNATVSGKAKVSGKAIVCDNATVEGYATVGGNAFISGKATVRGKAIVCDNATVEGYAKVSNNAAVYGNAWVEGHATVGDNAKVYENAMVCGKARVGGDGKVSGNAWICGEATVRGKEDFIVFKNWWSSERYFTWTRSNNKWSVGCFYGSGEELIAKAYKDSEKSGREYERVVKYVNDILKEEDNGNRNECED